MTDVPFDITQAEVRVNPTLLNRSRAYSILFYKQDKPTFVPIYESTKKRTHFAMQ